MDLPRFWALSTVNADVVYLQGKAYLVLRYDGLPAFVKQISRDAKFKDAFYEMWPKVALLAHISRSKITHVQTNGHFLFWTHEFISILRSLNLSHCSLPIPCRLCQIRWARILPPPSHI